MMMSPTSRARARQAGVLVALLSLTACGGNEEAAPNSRTTPPLARNSGEDEERASGSMPTSPGSPSQETVGTIAGRVVFRGPAPRETTMVVPDAGTIDAHTLHVDTATGGLRDTAVWIDGPLAPARPVAELPPAVVDQSNWTFEPHVLAVRAGQKVEFRNSDIANHSIRSETKGSELDVVTPTGVTLTRRFRRPTGLEPVRLDCDFHDWMRAWIYVFEHDGFAVTGRKGDFRIDGMPPGKWILRVHHADGGLERAIEVLVESGRTITVEVALEPGDN